MREPGPPPPDAWLRGPVEGVIAELQPVAHSVIQAREDLARIVPRIPEEALWHAPGGAASPGFHLRHLAGSTDRLLSYARGEPLSQAQRRHLATEKEPQPDLLAEDLLEELDAVLERALGYLAAVEEAELDEERWVGRARLPANVRGLLFHMSEHATRHVGQLITTLNVGRDRPVPHGPVARPPEERRREHAPGGALPHPPNPPR